MSLVLVVLLCAVLLGRIGGGSLDRLGALDLRRRRLVVAALVVQALGTVVGGPFTAVGLAGSAALVTAFLVANRGVRGTGLVALGLGANALVVALNGAMPVAPAAAARAGVALDDVAAGLDRRHVVADGATRLPLLGDVVPVLLPLRPEVVSPGDVLVAAGLAQLVVVGMVTGRRPARVPGPPLRDLPGGPCATLEVTSGRESAMAKRGRKRRARKKNAANHGKRPNA